MLEKDIKKVLVSHDEIVEAAKKLGETLTKEYQGKKQRNVVIVRYHHVSPFLKLKFHTVITLFSNQVRKTPK